MRSLWAAGLLALAGCTLLLGDDFEVVPSGATVGPGGGGEGAGAAAGGGGELRDVMGTHNVVYVIHGGEELVQTDLSSVVIKALSWDGNAFDEVDGQGDLNGTFSIAGVPLGDYYLRVDAPSVGLVFEPAMIVTDSAQVDLSYRVMGRRDAEPVTLPTPLTLNLSGMQAWVNGDDLSYLVPGAGVMEFLLLGIVDNPPAQGAVSLSMTFDSADLSDPKKLVSSVKGDRGVVTHLMRSATALGATYLRLGEIAYLDPFTQVNGQPATVSGTFEEVVADQTLAFDLKATQFAAYAPRIHPDATVLEEYIFVGALPGSIDYGFYWGTADLAIHKPPVGVDVDDSLVWGNPFGPEWAVHGGVSVDFLIPIALGSNSPTNFVFSLRQFAPIADFAALPELTPVLAPIQNAQVDGSAFFDDQMLSTLTPVLTWEAPELGTATRYGVTVYRLYATGGMTRRDPVGRLSTKQTFMRIPTGTLASGETYVFQVRVDSIPSVDYDSHPNGTAFPNATAGSISGRMTTP